MPIAVSPKQANTISNCFLARHNAHHNIDQKRKLNTEWAFVLLCRNHLGIVLRAFDRQLVPEAEMSNAGKDRTN